MNASSRARILLIEDEAKTARAVVNSLKAEGFAPVWVETGEDGFFVLSSQHFDAVVLDWMLPGRSGLEVLKTVRAKDSKTPVLTHWHVADLDIDLTVRRVIRAGRVIDLTPREFDLLVQLFRNAGKIVSRETLAREVWQEVRRATPLDNVIDVHIARLRRKIDDGFACRLIHTVRGVGFVLREEVDA